VHSAQVQQIEMLEHVTHVPNAPEFVEGVVYIRGQVIPVINLRTRFKMDKIPYDLAARLLVVNLAGRIIGLAVDSAREFIQMEMEELLAPPEGLVGPGTEYLQGVFSLEDRLILLIDLHAMLNTREQTELQEEAFEARSVSPEEAA
jgi:purine-binding chemotaxis protein CheW